MHGLQRKSQPKEVLASDAYGRSVRPTSSVDLGGPFTVDNPTGPAVAISGKLQSFGLGPDMRLKFRGDPDPVYSFFAYDHDNVALVMDAYFTPAGWVASHTSAFLIYKVGSALNFYGDTGLTKGSTFTPTARAGMAADGTLTTTGGLGFRTGAGGTVAQATSKSTTVVLSKSCGTITMNGAALAADTSVSFTLTNTTIAAGDMVLVQHDGVGTLGAYNCTATPAAGSASITVRNLTPGSLSEAIVLRFVVIKAVTA